MYMYECSSFNQPPDLQDVLIVANGMTVFVESGKLGVKGPN